MSLWSIFFSALFVENIFIWHAIGLVMIVLCTYTLSESIWVGVRVIVFILVQTLFMILLRPFFASPGNELFLLLVLIAIELFVGMGLDIIIPYSRLEKTVVGFIRRGDMILPLVLSVIIEKKYPPMESMVYGLGLGMGFMSLLVFITAISIKFSFHRLHSRHVYMLKLFILGVFALVNL